MRRNWKMLSILALCVMAAGGFGLKIAFSHCQVPCGIYNDELRFEALYNQNITTIDKAMTQIKELSEKSDALSANQLSRWVTNKEEHADEIMHQMQQYFLAQRIKPADEGDSAAYKDYTQKLVIIHHIIIDSMKCKQTVDPANVESLKSNLDKLYKAYFGKDHQEHTHD